MNTTYEKLKEILSYNPETGLFTWLIKSCTTKSPGDIAGHTHKKTGYVSITINKKFNSDHRLAWLYMTGENPTGCIDHINQIRSDNRWCNLRDVTVQENNKNRRLNKNNKSGVGGVYFEKISGKWEVRIKCNKKAHYFGRYKTLEEAIIVRNEAIKGIDLAPMHGRYRNGR